MSCFASQEQSSIASLGSTYVQKVRCIRCGNTLQHKETHIQLYPILSLRSTGLHRLVTSILRLNLHWVLLLWSTEDSQGNNKNCLALIRLHCETTFKILNPSLRSCRRSHVGCIVRKFFILFRVIKLSGFQDRDRLQKCLVFIARETGYLGWLEYLPAILKPSPCGVSGTCSGGNFPFFSN
jgi:hypothetical protein